MTGFESKRDAAADKLQEPVCPKCGNNRQVWTNQITGNKTCHRVGCGSALANHVEDKLEIVRPERGPTDIAKMVEGMEVSIDVSTADHDSGNRLFGTVTLAQQNQNSKHGLILLVQDPSPNFKQPLPAQEPVAWKTMEAKYPSLEKLDIRMGDGSILCDVWPQSDGDFWWAGSGTGEKFIDPKYADVTHWRVHSDTTAPPQRGWVELTDDEYETLWVAIRATGYLTKGQVDEVMEAVEAKLKERNHGT